jgi:nucleoside-diphosphate-sugar epimerase
MRILSTGICGFVGSRLALALRERMDGVAIQFVEGRLGDESNAYVQAPKSARL